MDEAARESLRVNKGREITRACHFAESHVGDTQKQMLSIGQVVTF